MFHSIYSVTWVSARTYAAQQKKKERKKLCSTQLSQQQGTGASEIHISVTTSPSPNAVSFHKSWVDHPFVVTLGVSWFLSLDDLVDADVLFRCVNVAGPGLKKKKKKKKKQRWWYWDGSCNMKGCFIYHLSVIIICHLLLIRKCF